jgi:hypothetical protein
MAAPSPVPHPLTQCTTVATVVFLFFALYAPYWMGWNGDHTLLFTEKTYEQQYPAFKTMGKILLTKFSNPYTLSCNGAVLPHPREEVIEGSLKHHIWTGSP